MVEPVPGRRPDPVPFQQEARRPREEPEERVQELFPPPRPEPPAEAPREPPAAVRAQEVAREEPPPPAPRFGGPDDRGLFVDLFA